MSNNSFKNLQNKLQQLKKELEPDEPKRRAEGIRYLGILTQLIKESYVEKSTSDYMFVKTLTDSVSESKYFGGFTNRAKERLRIIEKRYNYIHEEKRADIE
tara:strand:- start:54 stop:356 length:303 start_codon:yes stop_codon:yes gene_type:complete